MNGLVGEMIQSIVPSETESESDGLSLIDAYLKGFRPQRIPHLIIQGVSLQSPRL